jgi:hypothetical protein
VLSDIASHALLVPSTKRKIPNHSHITALLVFISKQLAMGRHNKRPKNGHIKKTQATSHHPAAAETIPAADYPVGLPTPTSSPPIVTAGPPAQDSLEYEDVEKSSSSGEEDRSGSTSPREASLPATPPRITTISTLPQLRRHSPGGYGQLGYGIDDIEFDSDSTETLRVNEFKESCFGPTPCEEQYGTTLTGKGSPPKTIQCPASDQRGTSYLGYRVDEFEFDSDGAEQVQVNKFNESCFGRLPCEDQYERHEKEKRQHDDEKNLVAVVFEAARREIEGSWKDTKTQGGPVKTRYVPARRIARPPDPPLRTASKSPASIKFRDISGRGVQVREGTAGQQRRRSSKLRRRMSVEEQQDMKDNFEEGLQPEGAAELDDSHDGEEKELRSPHVADHQDVKCNLEANGVNGESEVAESEFPPLGEPKPVGDVLGEGQPSYSTVTKEDCPEHTDSAGEDFEAIDNELSDSLDLPKTPNNTKVTTGTTTSGKDTPSVAQREPGTIKVAVAPEDIGENIGDAIHQAAAHEETEHDRTVNSLKSRPKVDPSTQGTPDTSATGSTDQAEELRKSQSDHGDIGDLLHQNAANEERAHKQLIDAMRSKTTSTPAIIRPAYSRSHTSRSSRSPRSETASPARHFNGSTPPSGPAQSQQQKDERISSRPAASQEEETTNGRLSGYLQSFLNGASLQQPEQPSGTRELNDRAIVSLFKQQDTAISQLSGAISALSARLDRIESRGPVLEQHSFTRSTDGSTEKETESVMRIDTRGRSSGAEALRWGGYVVLTVVAAGLGGYVGASVQRGSFAEGVAEWLWRQGKGG